MKRTLTTLICLAISWLIIEILRHYFQDIMSIIALSIIILPPVIYNYVRWCNFMFSMIEPPASAEHEGLALPESADIFTKQQDALKRKYAIRD